MLPRLTLNNRNTYSFESSDNGEHYLKIEQFCTLRERKKKGGRKEENIDSCLPWFFQPEVLGEMNKNN